MLKLIAASVILFSTMPAFARGTYSGPDTAWYAAQYNKYGQWCCDVADGHRYDGDYTVNEDGSVTIDPRGVNRRLPAYMIIRGPNPTGHAVWWYLEGGYGHTDYCFAM